MDASTQITEEVKNATYNQLSETLLNALDQGAITADEAHYASNYILSRIDTLPSQLYLEAFLEELAQRWPCFAPLVSVKIAKEEEVVQQTNIQNIQDEIKQLSQS